MCSVAKEFGNRLFFNAYKKNDQQSKKLLTNKMKDRILKPTGSRKRGNVMKKGEKRKLELLLIAYRMFLSRGYENTSVDAIIEEAKIAKGTFYYYFESKEHLLEEVISMMIEKEADAARQILGTDIPVPQKIVAIISSLQPEPEEEVIENALMRPENIVMHKKIKNRLIETVVPIVSEAVKEGVKEGIFDCKNIPERVRMILVISTEVFDEGDFTKKDVEVFIDLAEKLFGAKAGTMSFIKKLIKMPKQNRS